jgi:integrase
MSIAWESTKEVVVKTQQFSADAVINDKIKLAVAGLWQPSIQNLFLEFPTDRDKELAADFIIDCVKRENIAVGTKRAYLVALARFASHTRKSFEAMTFNDLDVYVSSMQRDRSEDPDQSWISTQRAYSVPLVKFFKWMAYPSMTPHERKHLASDNLPPILKGLVLQTKKGSKTPVKAKDIWNDEDTAIFLKYCTENPRLRFYHALAIETSGRPGELLHLKIGDINIDTDSDGKLYAVLDIGRYGKKRQSRIVGITEFTIQYYQQYLLQQHPDSANKNSFIFISRERSANYRNVPISPEALRADYIAFRNKIIPKLLKRPDVTPESDKKHLQFLKEQKKWHPYTMRHSSLNKLARHPNVNDYILRQHAGWSKRSDMVEVYTHELKGDSVEHVMMAYGINIKEKRDKSAQQLRKEMVGSHCPFCHTVNIPDSQFCSSCHKPLTSISMNAVMKDAEESKNKIKELAAKQEILQANAASILRALMAAEMGAKPKVEIISWNAKEGSEGLFKAAAIARAENQKREREHQQQRHHDLNERQLVI